MFEYMARVVRIVDGDTLDVEFDLGFDVLRRERVRLVGINAPESNSKNPKERAAALKAKDYLAAHLVGIPGLLVRIRSEKPNPADKYGRYLARVEWALPTKGSALNWSCINDQLVALQLAVPYDGGARAPWVEGGTP